MAPIVRFYFSFRSPYAWFAAERWQTDLAGTNAVAERIPFYPTPGRFPNDPTLFPAKFAYVVKDVRRLAKSYGLTVVPPRALDTNWAKAHAAYLGVHADCPDRSEGFMLEMFRARFARGEDVAEETVIAEAATRAGVDATLATSSALSRVLQDQVTDNLRLGQERDGIFGAPSFVYQDELFWGHDRMPHLRARILEDAALARAS